MKIQEYIYAKKLIHQHLLSYITEEDDCDEKYQTLISEIGIFKQNENFNEFRLFLFLILRVSNNYHRTPNFFSKIEKIILFFEDQFKHNLKNIEIFNIFKSNKLLLLILFNNKILQIEDDIINFIVEKFKNKDLKYSTYYQFFYPEIQPFLQEDLKNENFSENFRKFEYNRKIGENESYICSLIRQDSIEEFISYITRKNISVNSTINPSIFETNSFLLYNKQTKNEIDQCIPSLIEYAAFFGSIQIIQYLKINGAQLNGSLWFYAIHSNNAELINFLEENNVEPEDKSFQKYYEEAIKCHHNNIAYYIENTMLVNDLTKDELNDFNSMKFSCIFCSQNYDFISDQSPNKYELCYACKYNYYKFVELLLKVYTIDINDTII